MRTIRFEERDDQGALVAWTDLLVHDDPRACALHGALGILTAAPESDGKARSLERIMAAGAPGCPEAEVEEAVILALAIIARSIEWRGIPPS